VTERADALREQEREVLLATIRDLLLHSRGGSLDADEGEQEAYDRAQEVLARYTPAT
jgi:hypothetical protein